MDWQFKVGLGAAFIFGLLPFAVKDMPHWVTWPGLTIGGLFIFWGLIPHHDNFPILPCVLFIGFSAAAAATAAWGYDLYAERASQPNVTLVAECGVFQPNSPANRYVTIIRMTKNGEVNTQGFAGGTTPQQAGILPQNANPFVWPCQLTNYGPVPVFSLTATLKLSLHEMMPADSNGGSRSSPEAKIKSTIPLLISKIDVGPSNAVTLIFMNLTPFTAIVQMPSGLEAEPLNDKRQFIPLSHPNLQGDVPIPFTLPAFEGELK